MPGTLDSFRKLLAEAEIDPEPVVDASYCGCALPDPCWGGHGWHWKRHDLASLTLWEKRRYAAARDGESREHLRAGWVRWCVEEDEAGRMDESGMHVTWQPYVGLPVAYERCGPYMRAYRASLETAAAKRQGEKRKDYDGRPAGGKGRRA